MLTKVCVDHTGSTIDALEIENNMKPTYNDTTSSSTSTNNNDDSDL